LLLLLASLVCDSPFKLAPLGFIYPAKLASLVCVYPAKLASLVCARLRPCYAPPRLAVGLACCYRSNLGRPAATSHSKPRFAHLTVLTRGRPLARGYRRDLAGGASPKIVEK